ncbi:hypothetical protein BC834DRAFT_250486 [Gloeopeniophorella convolvens]|nr:hypothetical protein BC834DRAFT_250486 [Gloeopeniophorella convolvens]
MSRPGGTARKTTAPTPTLRKHAYAAVPPAGGGRATPHAKKAAYPNAATSSGVTLEPATAQRPLITSRPYAIAGVVGFHRGAKPRTTESPVQAVRRRKPAARKHTADSEHDDKPRKVGSARISNQSRFGTFRHTAERSGIGHFMNRRPGPIILSQSRNQISSAAQARIVFGKTARRAQGGEAGEPAGSDISSDEGDQPLADPNDGVRPGLTLRRPLTSGDAGGDPWKDMIASFGALSLSTAVPAKKGRLPFLRRTVRKSFLQRCRKFGLASHPTMPKQQLLTIIYKMPIDVSDGGLDDEVTEYTVHKVKLRMDTLVCPLCDTLGRLQTKDVIEAHLRWDHSGIDANWRQKYNGNWELTFELPEDSSESESSEQTTPSRSPTPRPQITSDPRAIGSPPPSEADVEHLLGAPSRGSSEAIKLEQHIPAFTIKRGVSPTLASSRTASLAPATASASSSRTPGPCDPLGPAAMSPYLPVNIHGSEESFRFSSRPGGQRLFDLVSRYPMSDYGLTSWSILERDEELFEIDDMRDEEKALQALWNRWIFSKRRQFFLDPSGTVTQFIDAFKPTITETAGWKGLRVWLLLLAKHRYLTGDDVVVAMGHYEASVGLKP